MQTGKALCGTPIWNIVDMSTVTVGMSETFGGTVSSTDILAAGTSMGAVTLHVANLDRMVGYYHLGVGLDVLAQAGDLAVLGRNNEAVIILEYKPALSRPALGSAGLYHTAILFEDQISLAAAVYSIASKYPKSFTGSSDHMVSKALYFDDPEGNGVELYWDRAREDWSWDAQGHVRMDTLALDPNAFLREHVTAEALQGPVGNAGIGHVHLQVGDVRVARAFYLDALGFEPTATSYPGALFASAGGYHHHIAMNVWHSAGAGPRAASLGLGDVAVSVPAREDLDALTARLSAKNVAFADDGRAVRVDDPWGTQVTVAVAGATTDDLLA